MDKPASHLVILQSEAPRLEDGITLRALGRTPCDGDLVFVRHDEGDIASGKVLANHEGRVGLMLVELEDPVERPNAYRLYQLSACNGGYWTLEKP